MTLIQEMKNDDGTIDCPHCEREKFTTPQGVQLHCMHHHGGHIPNSRCLECGREFFVESGCKRKFCDPCHEKDREDFPYPVGHERYEYALHVQKRLVEYTTEKVNNPLSGNHFNKNRFKRKLKGELTSDERSVNTFYHVVGELVKTQDYLVEHSQNSFEIDTDKLKQAQTDS